MDTVFFDLDGTLTDPKPGITGSIQYALQKLGRPVPAQDELACTASERKRPERYAADIQISAGYMHSGYPIMTHLDAPLVEVLWIETDEPYGPFGAKTLGEPTIIPTVAAVANAIYNAIGKRVKSLPITRDKVLGVLA